MNKFHISELNLDLIQPNKQTYKIPKQGGSRIVVIGGSGSGKSTIIDSIMYNKRHLIPVAIAMSSSEETNGFYSRRLPKTFTYDEFRGDKIDDLMNSRQKIARKHLSNPWAFLAIDDCSDDRKLLATPTMQALFKRSRQCKMLSVIGLQYALDVKASIRTSISGTFILREPNLTVRKTIFENFASIVGDFTLFCDLMDNICENYTALYIHNESVSNDPKDCVFYYKATPPPDWFKFGCLDYYLFHEARYNYENDQDIDKDD